MMYHTAMEYKQYFRNIIWTNHAIERMRSRGLSQEIAGEAFTYPDRSMPGKTKDSLVFEKRYDRSLVTIVAKQNEKNEWIILSAWIDPPVPGSPDAKAKKQYFEYQKASGLKKFWIAFKKQIGF